MNIDTGNINIPLHLPLEDNSVDEIIASHVLEHIGDGYIPLLQEIYRVCCHGAIIDITCPHHFHEVFYGDPTHKRPITVNQFYLFSKKHNRAHVETGGGSSGLGMKYGVDFEVVWFDFTYDPFYVESITAYKEKVATGKVSKEENMMFTRLLREATNVAQDVRIKLVVIKE